MTTLTPLPYPSAYDAEQSAAIEAAVSGLPASDSFLYVVRGAAVVCRGPQYFAIDGDTAHELLCARIDDGEGSIWEYLPVWNHSDGAVAIFPDEGEGGYLHLMRCVAHPRGRTTGWSVLSIPTGWLRTSELGLDNESIRHAVADWMA